MSRSFFVSFLAALQLAIPGLVLAQEAPVQEGPIFVAEDILLLEQGASSDVFVAGSNIEVRAPVGGDVFALGGTVDVRDHVLGDVRAAGNTVTISGLVDGNVLIVGNDVRFTRESHVLGHVNVYGATVLFEGIVDGLVDARGADVIVDGALLRGGRIEGEDVSFGALASTGGPLAVFASEPPAIDPAAQGMSFVSFENLVRTVSDARDDSGRVDWMRVGYWYAVFALIGLTLLLIWPRWMARVRDDMRNRPGRCWGKAAIYFFGVPAAAFVLLFTFIGIPLSLLLLALFALFFPIGGVLAGYALGHAVFEQKPKGRAKPKLPTRGQEMVYLLAGYALFVALATVPYIGWLVCLGGSLWGVGGMIESWFVKERTA